MTDHSTSFWYFVNLSIDTGSMRGHESYGAVVGGRVVVPMEVAVGKEILVWRGELRVVEGVLEIWVGGLTADMLSKLNQNIHN
ncbi:hypothetical protein Tco_0844208 [Tanacetum coccineum]